MCLTNLILHLLKIFQAKFLIILFLAMGQGNFVSIKSKQKRKLMLVEVNLVKSLLGVEDKTMEAMLVREMFYLDIREELRQSSYM